MASYVHVSNLLMGVFNGIGVKTGKPIENKTLYTYMSVATPLFFFRTLAQLDEYELRHNKKVQLPYGFRSSLCFVVSATMIGAQVCMGTQLGKGFSHLLQ